MRKEQIAICVSGLNKKFGDKKVVSNVSMTIKRGEICGFLGPNGSGKTTTLRLICGLLTPDSGQGQCLGFDISTQSLEIKKRVGYMTQKFSYWSDLTIRENLEFTAKMYGLDRIKMRVDKTLSDLNLTSRQHQKAEYLSGGWKQRLALAACILHEPEVLLLDEPTAGVDPQARREFWDEIHQLAASGMTVLVSTHYMDEAERCHSIIYMSYGVIVTQGTVRDLIEGSGLSTWVVQGPDLISLANILRKIPSVTTIAPFGQSLHVSSLDSAQLASDLQPYLSDQRYQWQNISPSFEDVFIRYMQMSQDNFKEQQRAMP